MNLLNMGVLRWLGVLLSFAGGYLVITAVSSPQQQPLAALLGGKVPPRKPEKRLVDPYGNPIAGISGALEDPTHLPILPDAIRYMLFILGGNPVVLVLSGLQHSDPSAVQSGHTQLHSADRRIC